MTILVETTIQNHVKKIDFMSFHNQMQISANEQIHKMTIIFTKNGPRLSFG